MVQDRDRVPELVVAPLERVGDAVLGWTSRCPDARRGPVGHRRSAGILCKGSLRRIVAVLPQTQTFVGRRAVIIAYGTIKPSEELPSEVTVEWSWGNRGKVISRSNRRAKHRHAASTGSIAVIKRFTARQWDERYFRGEGVRWYYGFM